VQDTNPSIAPRALQQKWLPTALGLCSPCFCSIFTAVCVCVCTWMGEMQSKNSTHHVNFTFYTIIKIENLEQFCSAVKRVSLSQGQPKGLL